MDKTETDSIQSTVRKLNSKRVQIATSASIVSLQLELIVRTFMRGMRQRKIVISQMDGKTDNVLKQNEFYPNDTKDMETYLTELGADNQTKRCMTWIRNKTTE